ncbi:MAG: hypothetical protein HY791_20180 [Deltaproteobacteria bacterium]|nr:hypothetical protein [Deltaproteobacteria bacterium]
MVFPWITILMTQASASVELLVLNPRCVNDSNSSINAISALVEHGRLEVTSSGFSVLEREGTYLVPEGDVSRHALAARVVAGTASLRREVLDASLPVLVSPIEVLFQWPRSRFDWLARIQSTTMESATRDVERTNATLVRLSSGDASVMALELSGTSTLSTTDPLDLERMYVAVAQLSAPDDEATFYSIGRPLGSGGRVTYEVMKWKSERPGGLLLHPGAAIDPWVPQEQQERCASALLNLDPSAIVPRAYELGLGLDEFVTLAKRHRLPYVAANLEASSQPVGSEEARLFPRFRIFETASPGGRLVTAVIGVVDPKALSALTAAARGTYRVRDIGPALTDTKEAIFKQLGRYPDFTVALVGAESARAIELVDRAHVDLVVGDFPKGDTVPVLEQFRIPPGTRERARYPSALTRLRGGDFSISFVSARFEPSETGALLTEVTHELRPILTMGPKDAAAFRAVRELDEKTLARQERVVMPDVAPFVEKSPSLLPLVYGDRVPNRGGFRKIERPAPIRLTDELWMRLVTNAMLDELDADVSLSRCPHRTSDMIGPISQMFIDNWIRIADTVGLVEVSGTALLAIGEVITSQRAQDSSADWIHTGGFDVARGKVRGRPVDPRARYKVALTDEVAERPEIAKSLRDGTMSARFREHPGGWKEDEGGKELPLRAVIQRRIDRWGPNESGYLPRYDEAFARALADRSSELEPRWQLRIDDVSMSGTRYDASQSSELFAETRETRLTTPDNLSLSAKLDVALIYDGPALAWETRAQAVLDRVLIEIPGVDIPAQEQADDAVAFSELRLLAVSLGSGGDGVPITPFARVTFDSEITPTPDPEGGSFPHQRIFRGALGLVGHPGKVLRELRLGALLQEDLSGDPRQDFGLTFGYSLYWPILDSLAFESRLDGRWLARDSDDLARDLSVYVQWPNRLRVPFTRDLAAFLLADIVLARGKADPARVVASSIIFGAGLSFSRVFEL